VMSFPPRARNFVRSGLSVLITRSEARARCLLYGVRQILVADIRHGWRLPRGVPKCWRSRLDPGNTAGSCDGDSNGFPPARTSSRAPRHAVPHLLWSGEAPRPLSIAGGGTDPSVVGPYHILFIAVACAGVTQSPWHWIHPVRAQHRASFVGSYAHCRGSSRCKWRPADEITRADRGQCTADN